MQIFTVCLQISGEKTDATISRVCYTVIIAYCRFLPEQRREALRFDGAKELFALRIVRFFQWLFLVLLLCTVIGLFGLNFPTFHRDQAVVISSEEDHEIYGRFYQGTKEMGVFIVGDPQEDQMALGSLAQEFYGSGAHIMTIDYSGHGVSGSDVDAQWLEKDGLTDGIRKGLDVFRRKAGIEDENIIVVGHGYGARNLLQVLVSDQNTFRGACLVAPDIALTDDYPDSPYFGERDDRSVNWISGLNGNSVSVPLQLIATETDERVDADSVIALYQKLAGLRTEPKLKEDEDAGVSTANSGKKWLTVIADETVLAEPAADESAITTLINKVMHTVEEFDRGVGQKHDYQLLSNAVSTVVKDWCRGRAEMRSISSTTIFPMLRLICWHLAALGMAAVAMLSIILAWRLYPAPEEDPCGFTQKPIHALGISFGMWLPAALVALVFVLIFNFLPFGDLTGITLPVAMIGGYGLATLLLYALHLMPTAKGELQIITGGLSFWRSMTSVVMMIILGGYIAFVHYSGFAIGWLSGHHFAWAIALTIVLAVGFYGVELQCDIMTDNGANFLLCMLYRLIVLLPVLAVCLLFQDVLQKQTAVSMLVAFSLSGALRRHSGGRLLPCVGTAFLFCMMILPASILIG